MKIKEIIAFLEDFAPPHLQESYDNSGLICGSPETVVNSALIALDLTDEVMQEAIDKGINLIITHHPILFKPTKRLNDGHFTGRLLIKAIRNDIAIYAIHTNLDSVKGGVSAALAEKLGLQNTKVLSPRKSLLRKLVTFCPASHEEKVRLALFNAGAGKLGNYDSCSFNSPGKGSFRALENANPYVGLVNELHYEPEVRIETIYPVYIEKAVIQALISSHPYEEVAYDIFSLENIFYEVGYGIVGDLKSPLNAWDFFNFLAETCGCRCIRHSRVNTASIAKVAICGGAGHFLIPEAISSGAEIFITSDLKYHDFFEADNRIILADIGHYESEQFACVIISGLLTEKFPNFANFISGENSNPVNYHF